MHDQRRRAHNECRRLTYHQNKHWAAYYNKDTATLDKRNRRWEINKNEPDFAHELRRKDMLRKREERSKLSDEDRKRSREKHAAREREIIAQMSPDRASLDRHWKAKNQRTRRDCRSVFMKEVDKYNDTVRKRAERDGKKVNPHKLLNRKDIEVAHSSKTKKFRRSPDTRKKHAEYERKRVASLSPGKAQERRKLRAKQEEERRNAKSETEKKQDRLKDAKRKQMKRSVNTPQSPPAIRKNFTINWCWVSVEDRPTCVRNYYTIIDGREYIQYCMHGLMIS